MRSRNEPQRQKNVEERVEELEEPSSKDQGMALHVHIRSLWSPPEKSP